jgi:hypothetical protein
MPQDFRKDVRALFYLNEKLSILGKVPYFTHDNTFVPSRRPMHGPPFTAAISRVNPAALD